MTAPDLIANLRQALTDAEPGTTKRIRSEGPRVADSEVAAP